MSCRSRLCPSLALSAHTPTVTVSSRLCVRNPTVCCTRLSGRAPSHPSAHPRMSWIDVPKSGLKAWADIASDFETVPSRGAPERSAGAGSTEKNYKRQLESGSPWRRSTAGS